MEHAPQLIEHVFSHTTDHLRGLTRVDYEPKLLWRHGPKFAWRKSPDADRYSVALDDEAVGADDFFLSASDDDGSRSLPLESCLNSSSLMYLRE